jgi:hypothetical protein
MIKFIAEDVDGNMVEGYGVLEMDGTRDYILFLERGYCSDINEDEMGAALYVYVKKETIKMIVK